MDCPACGRTLRVPVSEGATDISDGAPSTADHSLRSALEELSSLGQPSVSPSSPRAEPPESPAPRKNAARPLTSEVEGQRDSMRIIPLSAGTLSAGVPAATPLDSSVVLQSSDDALRQMAEITPGEMNAPLIVPGLLDSEISDAQAELITNTQAPSGTALSGNAFPSADSRDRPGDLASALQELATHHSETVGTAPSSLREQKNGGRLIRTAMVIIAAFVAGVFVGRFTVTSSPGQPSAMVSGPGKANVSQPVEAVEMIPELTVTGRVMYSDDAGLLKPDAAAFVLLVPADNKTGLKLDAQPLRDLKVSEAKLAVEAAIHVLKGSLARAADDGTFRLERRTSGPVKLIVISRHASRPESEPIDAAAAQTLAAWFDAPSQLTGRLQVQEKSIAAADQAGDTSVEVTFSNK